MKMFTLSSFFITSSSFFNASIIIFIYYYLLAPPLNWSKVASKFLQFTNYHIHVKVTRKRVNRGIGLGLEIPVKYFFMDMQELNMCEKIASEKLA